MSNIVKLKNVRLAFPKLFTAESVGKDSSKKYFSAAFPIEPDGENHKALEAGIVAAAKEKWPDKWETILKTLRKKGDLSYHHEELTNDEGDVYDGFQGMHSLNASRNETKGRPLVRDRNNTPLTEGDGRPYAGCYVNASVEVWAQDNANGKRINVSLRGVQFYKDGDAFGGGVPFSDDEFDELPEEEGDGDMFD